MGLSVSCQWEQACGSRVSILVATMCVCFLPVGCNCVPRRTACVRMYIPRCVQVHIALFDTYGRSHSLHAAAPLTVSSHVRFISTANDVHHLFVRLTLSLLVIFVLAILLVCLQ